MGTVFAVRRKRSQADFATSRWPEELPSDGEYTTALDTLERAGWKADYVLTHCAPTGIARQMNRHNQPDALTDFLELVNNRLEFDCRLFGHYHDNRESDPWVMTAAMTIGWTQNIVILETKLTLQGKA